MKLYQNYKLKEQFNLNDKYQEEIIVSIAISVTPNTLFNVASNSCSNGVQEVIICCQWEQINQAAPDLIAEVIKSRISEKSKLNLYLQEEFNNNTCQEKQMNVM